MGSPFDGDVSQFWLVKYGIANYGEFRGIVEKVLAGIPGFNLFGLSDTYAISAWVQPSLPAGLAVQLYLRRAGYTGAQGSAYQDAVDTASSASIQALQEAAVTTLIIPNAFQITVQATVGGHSVDNVFGVVNATGSSSGAAFAAKFAWENAGGPLQNLPVAYAVTQYQAVDLSSGTGAIALLASTAVGGDSTHSIATRGACALVKYNGASRSRSTRGRMYFGPLTEVQVDTDGASLTSTALSDITNNIDQFVANMSSQGYPLAVLSRKLSQATLVASHVVEAEIATQRRRIRS